METAIRSESTVRFERFELNLQTRELYRDGSRLKIRGHPVDVLAMLLEHPGELVTREMLRKQLWPDNTFVDFEQILNNSVGKLRDALGDQPEAPKYIETLPRLGYRFIAQVEKSAVNPAAQAPPNVEPDPAVPVAAYSERRGVSKRWIFWPALGLAGASVALAYWYVHLPLPAPRITHYEQLTLDGREKIALGTDGTRIYMNLASEQGIAQMPVSGGKVTEIPIDVPAGSASLSWFAGISPNGSSLLVKNQWTREEGWKVWVVGSPGHPARYLTRANAAAWSPDGRSVAFANRHGDIYTIGSDGGEPRLLYRVDAPAHQLTGTPDMSWSPDGSTIRLTRWGGRIFEISSTGSGLREFLPGWNGSMQKCCGRWTPDGQFYLFLAGRTLGKGPLVRPLAEIWAVDERRGRIRSPRTEPVLLAPGPLLWGNPVPSRDGAKIFARGVSLRGELQRYVPASRRLEPYLGGISAEMLDFSRDGKYVAYVSFPDGILWRANPDGSGQVQLTEPPFYPRNPRWSPDGAQILFTDNTQNGVDTIYLISAEGGSPKRLLPDDGGPQSVADWSPDGKKVVYTVHPGFSFMLPWEADKIETRIVELATGRVTILPKRPSGLWAPEWSPDGRYIAGQSFEAMDLLIFDLKTEEWRVLPQKWKIGYHHWSHNGEFIYFIRWLGNRPSVYRVPVQGGREELVTELPKSFRGTGWYSFWMSLDPTDAPLLLRDVGTDEIYALTLERK